MAAARGSRVRAALCFAAALACLVPHEALAMNASFSWAGIAPCKRVSPAFMIEDAPAGTKRLRFMLHDEDAPHFHHGGSTVAYTGPKVPQGAISYIGPCPPPGDAHHYVWTIEARDAKGHVLAKTTAAAVFPMK
ncbi:MAG: YbhB/YbcL family Raf kinase inhibitor-like protein [Methylovirgula sp.]